MTDIQPYQPEEAVDALPLMWEYEERLSEMKSNEAMLKLMVEQIEEQMKTFLRLADQHNDSIVLLKNCLQTVGEIEGFETTPDKLYAARINDSQINLFDSITALTDVYERRLTAYIEETQKLKESLFAKKEG